MVFGSSFIKSKSATIIEMFKRTVDMAVVTKCSLYCKSVAIKVTIKIRYIYQKFIAVSGAVSAIRWALQPMACSLVIYSGAKVTSNEPKIIKRENLKKIAVEKTPLLEDATKEGIKACVKAPSAKMFLKRFGSLFARKKISLQ